MMYGTRDFQSTKQATIQRFVPATAAATGLSRVRDKRLICNASIALRLLTNAMQSALFVSTVSTRRLAALAVLNRLGDLVVATTLAAAPEQPANPMNPLLASSQFQTSIWRAITLVRWVRLPRQAGGLSRTRTDNSQGISLVLYRLSYQQRCFL